MRPLRRGLKSNIFDNMLAMTEKYASNLEALVDERTQLLIEEKQVWTPLRFFEFALTRSQNYLPGVVISLQQLTRLGVFN